MPEKHANTRCILAAMLAVVICRALPGAAAESTPQIARTTVFSGGTEGYHTYRIPVLFMTQAGTLLAFCEGRKNSAADDGDIDLLLRRSVDAGKTWEPLQLVHEEGGTAEITIGNPCIVQEPASRVLSLAFCRNNRRAFIAQSRDDGRTWTPPIEITAAFGAFPFAHDRLATGPVNGVRLESGRLVMPVWLNASARKEYRAAVIYSDDAGTTWAAGGLVPDTIPNGNEHTIAEVEPNVLCSNLRHKGAEKVRAVSWSHDGGLTWSPPALARDLPDPVCQGSLLRAAMPDGPAAYCLTNCASERRNRLTLRVSRDGCQTWGTSVVLNEGPSAYSCLAAISPGQLGCLFECGSRTPYESITFAVIRLP